MKKRAAGKILFTLILILWLALAAVFGLFLLLQGNRPEKRLLGEWTAQVSLKEEAVEYASRFLYEARMGDQISLREELGDPKITLILSFQEDGSFSRSIDQTSYEQALSDLREGLSFALYRLVILRAAEKGRENLALEDAKTLTEEALGMEAEAYFAQSGLPLLPPLEELKLTYEQEGAFHADRELLTLGEEEMSYITDGKLLMLKRSTDQGNSFEHYEKIAREEDK